MVYSKEVLAGAQVSGRMNTPFMKAAASARVALQWGQNSSGPHPGAIPTTALLTPVPTGSCSAIAKLTPPCGMGGSSDPGGEYPQLIRVARWPMVRPSR